MQLEPTNKIVHHGDSRQTPVKWPIESLAYPFGMRLLTNTEHNLHFLRYPKQNRNSCRTSSLPSRWLALLVLPGDSQALRTHPSRYRRHSLSLILLSIAEMSVRALSCSFRRLSTQSSAGSLADLRRGALLTTARHVRLSSQRNLQSLQCPSLAYAPSILVSRRTGGSDSCVRLFSNDGKDNGKDGPDREKEAVGRDDARDLFGLSGHGDEDNSSSTTKSGGGGGSSNPVDWLGPPETWPPKYKRDAATGRLLVEEVEEELTDRDRQILQADPLERDQMTLKQLERHWTKQAKGQRPSATSDDRGDGSSGSEDGGSGPADVIDQLGRRIRETDMSTNVLGRSVTVQVLPSVHAAQARSTARRGRLAGPGGVTGVGRQILVFCRR
jgi:hypothetical protein